MRGTTNKGGKAVSKYIDVDVFIKSFREALPGLKAQVDPDLTPKAYACLRGGEAIIEDLTKFPAADVVEVLHGQWDGEGDGYADGEIVIDVWYCSECGYCIDDGTDDPNILPNYCPNCGAYMMGENNGKCE